MNLAGITHVVTDLEKSKAFYEGVLGFTPAGFYEPSRWQAYQVQPGVFFALGEPPGSTPEVAFAVPDLEGLWARLKDQAEVVHPLEQTPWGTYRFVIRDPEGQLLAFSQKQSPDLHAIIRSQYRATLAMLAQAVEKCPPEMWDDPQDRNKFWHVAYHALFYTHLYLHPVAQDFVPWSQHRPEYEFMGPLPWPPHKQPEIGEPYTRQQVLAFYEFCLDYVDQKVPVLDLAADSGFDWLPFSKLELQFYNLRHLQQHTGELMERLGSRAGIDVDWQGSRS
jgi:predicted enzyme related to lactoylglutathione lyase